MTELLRVMAKARISKVRVMLEYTFDADPRLSEWRDRRDQMEYYFRRVVTKQNIAFVDTVAGQFEAHCANQADIWFLEGDRDGLALWCGYASSAAASSVQSSVESTV